MNQSVKKAFDILTFVINNNKKLSLNKMAQILGMNKTTLYRFLNTLESIDVLGKIGNTYVPGIKLFQLGSKVPVKQLVVDKIHPILQALSEEVNETVNMGQFSNDKVFYLDKTESQRSLQIRTRVGDFINLHASALGKSVMSILPEPTRESVFKQLTFERKTRHTITDLDRLKEDIKKIQEIGYSTDIEEWEEGLCCVAVPLHVESLDFYGAISFSGPSVRFTPKRIIEMAQRLNETATRIIHLFEEETDPLRSPEMNGGI